MSELFYTCVIIEINTEQQYQMFRGKTQNNNNWKYMLRGKHRTTMSSSSSYLERPEIYL